MLVNPLNPCLGTDPCYSVQHTLEGRLLCRASVACRGIWHQTNGTDRVNHLDDKYKAASITEQSNHKIDKGMSFEVGFFPIIVLDDGYLFPVSVENIQEISSNFYEHWYAYGRDTAIGMILLLHLYTKLLLCD